MINSQQLVLSADTHIVEPPDLFTSRVKKEFRESAPRVATVDGIETWLLEGRPLGVPLSVGYRAGDRFMAADERPPRNSFVDDVDSSGYVASEWLKRNEGDGVYGGVVFPSHVITFYATNNSALLDEVIRVYNDWIYEFAVDYLDRIKPIGLINLDEMGSACRTLEQLKSRGFGGVLIPVTPWAHLPYSSTHYEPFWAAAAEMEMPLELHIISDRNPSSFGGLGLRPASRVNIGDHNVRMALTDIVMTGVFDRHPRLRVVSVENEAAWVPFWLQQMDWHYKYNFRMADLYRFGDGLVPSDFFADHVFVSFTEDAVAVKVRELIGVDNLMWGSDFPHAESTFPRSIDILNEQFTGVDAATRHKLTVENAKNLYGLTLPTPGEPGPMMRRPARLTTVASDHGD